MLKPFIPKAHWNIRRIADLYNKYKDFMCAL